MSLDVIGAGFGRTGTDSLREALGLIGFGPCHHMIEVNTNEEQKRLWRALVAGEPSDWSQLFAGFRSAVDWPAAHYWRELIEVYPDAKVILTYRSPESWWTSFEQTIGAGIRQGGDPRSLGLALIRDRVFGGRPHDRAHAIATYEANVAAVRATVPPDRLLVYELGDGWDPLCQHLGVSVPNVPYPNRNSAASFRSAFGGAAPPDSAPSGGSE